MRRQGLVLLTILAAACGGRPAPVLKDLPDDAAPSDAVHPSDGHTPWDGPHQADAPHQADGPHQWDGPYQFDAPYQWDAPHPWDSGAVTCLVPADFGAVGAIGGDVDPSSTPETVIYYLGALNHDSKPDMLAIELWSGYGVFGGGITTGTFYLTGDETSYQTCGACVLIHADYDANTGTSLQTYLATGGTLTITAVTPRLVGTLSGVRFTRVIIDPNTYQSTPAGDCYSAIASCSFDA